MKKLFLFLVIMVLPAIVFGDTDFNFAGSMLIFSPRIGDGERASAVRAIAGGIRYRPEVAVDNETVKPSRIAFSADYYQNEISAIGISYYPASWEGVDFSVGARALMRGTPESLTVGGELRLMGEFSFGDQKGFFVLGGGYIPDDLKPLVFEIGLGVLTE